MRKPDLDHLLETAVAKALGVTPPRKLNRRSAGLLAPPPNTHGPSGGGPRKSTFKEVRRAVA